MAKMESLYEHGYQGHESMNRMPYIHTMFLDGRWAATSIRRVEKSMLLGVCPHVLRFSKELAVTTAQAHIRSRPGDIV